MQNSKQKLHLGCGRTILEGWINVDSRQLPGVDVVADFDDCRNTPLPFADNSVDEFLASHLIEHLAQPLPFMQELYRIARADAVAVFRLPYGSSDEAYEDPTHVRQYFLNSFGYFSQPHYWRADYGYRGDWETETITLRVDAEKHPGKTSEQIMQEVHTLRNVVREMVVELRAIKPPRAPKAELQKGCRINIKLV
jgi:SAM-dependent methyltransferase